MTTKLAPSNRSFQKGLASLASGNVLEALAYFESSLKLEENSPNLALRARLSSYYGYCLAAALGKKREALQICKQAASSEFFSPEILLNLARVQLLVDQRREAWDTLMRGLSLDPDHAGMRAELRKMGIRKRPAIPFLERSHALNRAAGKIVARRKSSSRK